jgi:response regulator RpfG family c-di-GMP phosphodiesterase
MDMRMPVMDGYEATRRIKAHPAGGKTIVVALTASAFEEDRSEVLAAGCDDFLRKPIRQALIYAALERHLKLRFRYAETERVAAALDEADLVTALRRLPEEQRVALSEHALVLDAQTAAGAIQAIASSEPQLAAALRMLLSEYRFDEILRLLEEAAPGKYDNGGGADEKP